jgi:hypothetical protein
MFLSKHHYAIALARGRNEVYFLNPPSETIIKNDVEIVESKILPSLFIINHSIYFSKRLKFKWIWLFHLLMKFHIKKIEKAIGKQVDIIWSFDLGNYYPFKYFASSSYKIFSPYDKPQNIASINSAVGCNIIISIAKEIIEYYTQFNVPKYFMHHGLADEFFEQKEISKNCDSYIRVGLSGNWMRNDIDIKCILKIISENPDVIFEFWGSYQSHQSNIGSEKNMETADLMMHLKNEKNVIIHGVKHPKELARQFQRMDAFLIAYDILKDQSRGTNYHKIMEYLSTGKVVISNNITTYSNLPDLIEMTKSRQNNNELPGLFKTVINNLKYYNQPKFIRKRKDFALGNLYSDKINEIAKIVLNNTKSK